MNLILDFLIKLYKRKDKNIVTKEEFFEYYFDLNCLVPAEKDDYYVDV